MYSRSMGMALVMPGVIRARSTPVRTNRPHHRSTNTGARISQASDARGAHFLEANPTARCPTPMAASYNAHVDDETALAFAPARPHRHRRQVARAGAARALGARQGAHRAGGALDHDGGSRGRGAFGFTQ